MLARGLHQEENLAVLRLVCQCVEEWVKIGDTGNPAFQQQTVSALVLQVVRCQQVSSHTD